MGGFTKMLKLIFNKKAFQKISAYVLLILLLFIFKDFLGIFLLTFIFSFLFFSIAKYIKEKSCSVSKKYLFLKFFDKLPVWLIILIEYVLFIGLIVYLFSSIIPNIKSEINSITNEFSVINSVDRYNENLTFIQTEEALKEKSGSVKIIIAISDFKENLLQKLIIIDPEDNLNMTEYIEKFGEDFDFKSIQENSINFLSTIGSSILKIILALILSLIFILDRKQLNTYLLKIKKSNLGFFYDEYKILFEKVVKSFGLILKAQGVIASVNAILTVIGLLVIGFVFSTPEIHSFPYILTLGLVVFLMGFIPVLGVILSSIPIMLIGYITYGDFMIIPVIILLILIIHTIEAYYLNPKIVSSYLKLPMSLTFIILLVSEHLFGLAGLLVGISMFYFLLGLIKDFNEMIGKNKKKLELKNKKTFTKK
ncbi:MAG: AI-2E family transporter [Candidatus Gracilibacteria bacterium]|nr:AI-2E family transporter [Candidatus Gracilibacteria bacterium]